VSDAGIGISAGQSEQIFNAFITTKAAGTGMDPARTQGGI
jgi:signal transduction histidine kinase